MRQTQQAPRREYATKASVKAISPDVGRYEELGHIPAIHAILWRTDPLQRKLTDVTQGEWLGYLKQITTPALLRWLAHTRRCGGWYDPLNERPMRGYTTAELKGELALRPHVRQHARKHEVIKTDPAKGRRIFLWGAR